MLVSLLSQAPYNSGPQAYFTELIIPNADERVFNNRVKETSTNLVSKLNKGSFVSEVQRYQPIHYFGNDFA